MYRVFVFTITFQDDVWQPHYIQESRVQIYGLSGPKFKEIHLLQI